MMDGIIVLMGFAVAVVIAVLGTKDITKRCSEFFNETTYTDASEELKRKP